ncbi:MAG: IclR family transcriptional regulator [Spirochaetaceae bacterium]|nr:MAG: IclR family transcriptional regulator [Spirochaetaceae bacterium]
MPKKLKHHVDHIEEEAPEGSVPAVSRTMQILEQLSMAEGIGVNEISRSLGLHKSTVFRFLSSLRNLHYVQQDPVTEQYRATIKLFELGARVVQQMEFVQYAKQVMETLAAETDETIHLAVLENDKLVYLHKIESTQTLRVFMKSRPGQTAPLHCTGLGKCMLAFSRPDLVDTIATNQALTGFTPKTRVTVAALEQDLEQTRQCGYARDDEEHEPGVSCIAAPLLRPDGTVIAALSISMPTARVTDTVTQLYAEKLRAAAQEVRRRMSAADTSLTDNDVSAADSSAAAASSESAHHTP